MKSNLFKKNKSKNKKIQLKLNAFKHFYTKCRKYADENFNFGEDTAYRFI